MIIKTSYPFMKPPPSARLIRGHRLSQGLVGHWLFNEGSGNKVFDLSGNGIDGTLQGNASFSPGKFGSAISGGLDTADHILIPNTTQLTSDLSQVTFVIWAKNNKTNIGATGSEVFINCTGAGTDSYAVSWTQPEDVYFSVFDAGLGDVTLIETDWLTDDLWHQWVFTYDGATMRMYKDTVEASGTASQTGNINDNGHPIKIGGSGASDSWDGLIDHVLIYNYVLSASERVELYWKPFGMLERKARTALMSGYEVVTPPVGMAGAMTTNSGYWGW